LEAVGKRAPGAMPISGWTTFDEKSSVGARAL